MDGGAWWAAVCGVAQSRTRLKQLSSSSSSSKTALPKVNTDLVAKSYGSYCSIILVATVFGTIELLKFFLFSFSRVLLTLVGILQICLLAFLPLLPP